LFIILVTFTALGIFTAQHINPALAADDERVWVDEDWNILTLVPDGWDWREDFGEDIPVVFLPSDKDNKGIPDFVFVTHLGKQSGSELESLKKEYIKGLREDLKLFKLNSAENVSTVEGLEACDLSYTFKEEGKLALGYDRLVFTEDDILWAISFSAGKDDFKKLKDGAISIIDSFIFDAANWLEERQKKKDK
jgi:hypothetical protein